MSWWRFYTNGQRLDKQMHPGPAQKAAHGLAERAASGLVEWRAGDASGGRHRGPVAKMAGGDTNMDSDWFPAFPRTSSRTSCVGEASKVPCPQQGAPMPMAGLADRQA